MAEDHLDDPPLLLRGRPDGTALCTEYTASHLAAFDVMVEGRCSARPENAMASFTAAGRHYAAREERPAALPAAAARAGRPRNNHLRFYALFSDFPGTAEAAKTKHIPHERVRKLEDALRLDIGDPRLIPHIQLHEFETILFCDLNALSYYFDDCGKKLEALRTRRGTASRHPGVDR